MLVLLSDGAMVAYRLVTPVVMVRFHVREKFFLVSRNETQPITGNGLKFDPIRVVVSFPFPVHPNIAVCVEPDS